jgi:hypothetical protein
MEGLRNSLPVGPEQIILRNECRIVGCPADPLLGPGGTT